MTNGEQVLVCKIIAKACMWGNGGLASVIIEELDKKLKQKENWSSVFKANKRISEYEATGVIKDEEELRSYLGRGYTLHNYKPGELALFFPGIGRGLAKYVVGELADKYGEIYDKHNFNCYKNGAVVYE